MASLEVKDFLPWISFEDYYSDDDDYLAADTCNEAISVSIPESNITGAIRSNRPGSESI